MSTKPKTMGAALANAARSLRPHALAAPLLAALLVSACGPGYQSSREKLHETATRFNDNVRWQRYRAAAAALPLDRRESWVAAMQRASQHFTVADYEVRPVEVGPEQAVLEVDMVFHRVGGVVIEQMRRRQIWQYASGSWLLVSDMEIPHTEGPPPDSLPELQAPPAVAAGHEPRRR